ncbi:hypothetical protein F2Q69_00047073 [Brassica cretica]|uniref:LsmAD domain-containing protein n=1 Tax=Brassica cretica TaxID=69181 RepID=A0A8S9PQ83_BRACR|nr:hypothetical protein F2Q69_00047073 [Brassica cretica]
MNSQPLSNGYPYRRVEHQAGGMNKAQQMKKNGGKAGTVDISSRDPFEYLAACHIGHRVEVHLKDGSVYGAVFHAADVDNSFGIVLKMASLIREGTLPGMKPPSPLVSKPPSKILIIPADEVVQVIAKDLPVYSDNASNSAQCERPLELLTDSSISQSTHVDLGRELERWVPDEDVPDCSDLENVFDDPWKRGWNQFEVNKTLFGVTSTFDEELYTTKLERGPRTRELEEQALRIAREIEDINEDAATSDPWRASDRQNSTDGKLLGRLSDRAKPESSCWRPGSSISRNPENSATSSPSSRPMLSPSSSIGSYSSEKSTLNPNAKEFKPNPNAKSFKPSPTATRPQSPVPEGSFYYPPLPPMPGIHIMGAAFPGQHPVMYNNTPQLGPNQTYYSPNSPQYPQQMMVGPQRPALFMPPPPYQPEMQYKGRDSY